MRSYFRYRRLDLRPPDFTKREKKYLWNLHKAIRDSPHRHLYGKDLKKYHSAYKAAHSWFKWGWRIGKPKTEVVHKLIRPVKRSKYWSPRGAPKLRYHYK